MSETPNWRENGVRIVRRGELDHNTPQTPGMTRAAAINHATTDNRYRPRAKEKQEATMIPELEIAVLTVDRPDLGLRAGDEGVVVDISRDGSGYAIEFFTPEGDTKAIAFLDAEQVRAASAAETASAPFTG